MAPLHPPRPGRDPEVPETIAGCEECLATGHAVGAPAHVPDLRPHRLLRQLARRHATAHNGATGHPIIRSAEPNEDWSFCYEDDLMFILRSS